MTNSQASQDFTDMINAVPDGWVAANGLRFVSATTEKVIAEMKIEPHHLQAYGLVHGGVYAGIIETLASVGAALNALPKGKGVVGIENHTSFIHAVRVGVLHSEGVPITRGSRSQVWEVTVRDDGGRIAATGRVRILVVDEGSPVAGAQLSLKKDP